MVAYTVPDGPSAKPQPRGAKPALKLTDQPIDPVEEAGAVGGAPLVPKVYKVHIQLTEKAYNRLIDLKQKADLVSVSEVVREALRVYDILFDEIEKGKTLMLQDPATPNMRELIRLF